MKEDSRGNHLMNTRSSPKRGYSLVAIPGDCLPSWREDWRAKFEKSDPVFRELATKCNVITHRMCSTLRTPTIAAGYVQYVTSLTSQKVASLPGGASKCLSHGKYSKLTNVVYPNQY